MANALRKEPSDLYMTSPEPVLCRDLDHAISLYGIHPEDGQPVIMGDGTLIGFAYNQASAEACARECGVAFLGSYVLKGARGQDVAYLLLQVAVR